MIIRMLNKLILFFMLIYSLLAFSENATDENVPSENFPYKKESRVSYIENSLLAMQTTKPHILENTRQYIGVMDTNNCQSDMLRLRLNCIMNYANKNCQSLKGNEARNACKFYSDVIVSNRLGDNLFLSKSEEYRLARKHAAADLKAARSQKLRQKYANIVTQFILSDQSDCKEYDYACLARGLDQFCIAYTNKHDLSWNYCVSATLWLIGTAPKKDTETKANTKANVKENSNVD